MKSLRFFLQRQRLMLLTFLSFFLSVVLLGVLINLVSALLEIIVGSSPQRLLLLVIGLVLAVILLYALLQRMARETRRWLPLPREMAAQPRPGLIVLVGPGPNQIFIQNPAESPAAAAIRYHLQGKQLKHVWLIASDEGAPVAEALRNLYGEQATMHLILPPIRNILDISETFEAASRIAQELPPLGLTAEEVIADYTGGTSSMSVGLALAALRNGFAMQFMSRREGSESLPIQTGLQGNWKLTRRRTP